jgi:hypothetical protein
VTDPIAAIDAVLDDTDWITWHGSLDSAEWRADGKHDLLGYIPELRQHRNTGPHNMGSLDGRRRAKR